MRELEKISIMHKRGKFGMPEKDFLELIMCPYDATGHKDKRQLRRFLRERRDIEKMLPDTRANVKLAVDKPLNSVEGEIKRLGNKIKQHLSEKAQKVDEEQEKRDMLLYSNLAQNWLDYKRKEREGHSDEESLVGPNRRRTVNFGGEDVESEKQSEDELPEEGPRMQRVALPIELVDSP